MIRGSRAAHRVAVVTAAVGLLAATASPVSAARAAGDGNVCTDYGATATAPKGFIPRDDLQIVKKDPLAAQLAASRTSEAKAGAATGTTRIPVVFHVISKDRGSGGGNLSDARIDAQIDVLNDAFGAAGFSFDLQKVTRTVQPEWFNLISANGADSRYFRGSGKEIKMKQALHEGDAETLNLYSASLGQSLLGWAYLPWDFDGSNGQPLPRFFDGVVVDFRSLPQVGGDIGDSSAYSIYGEGDTGTHEVGHWLGLYHTFQSGCSEPGDRVADTPAEASPAFFCPEGRDTCPAPGLDPIRNFMDYTQDSCMNEFTPGQATRMRATWTEFREVG
jgi:hypothetical protein